MFIYEKNVNFVFNFFLFFLNFGVNFFPVFFFSSLFSDKNKEIKCGEQTNPSTVTKPNVIITTSTQDVEEVIDGDGHHDNNDVENTNKEKPREKNNQVTSANTPTNTTTTTTDMDHAVKTSKTKPWNKLRFENDELECLYQRYTLKMQRFSVIGVVSLFVIFCMVMVTLSFFYTNMFTLHVSLI